MQPHYSVSHLAEVFQHPDIQNTLEGIVDDKSLSEDTNALERIFSDKTRTLKAGVKALLEEIELREKLDRDLTNKIDDEIIQQSNKLEHLKRIEAGPFLETFFEAKKLIIKTEDKILNLEQEKRKEQLECWRDLMFLKKYLMSSLKEYWDLVKRGEVLRNR